jgi:phosphoribulokinase
MDKRGAFKEFLASGKYIQKTKWINESTEAIRYKVKSDGYEDWTQFSSTNSVVFYFALLIKFNFAM